MLFDTHTHLNIPEFKEDYEDVLLRAEEAGVSKMLIVGFDRPTITEAIKMIQMDSRFYGAVGWHPVDAIDMTEEDLLWIEELLHQPKVVALGEIGLDYHWDKSPKDIQKQVFRKQIQLARKCQVPIIIHNREATEDIVAILKEEHAEDIGGIMHCYSDNWDYAKQCLDMNFYISFGGPVTFKNAPLQREVAAKVPINRLLIETDCPYLSPHPFRGKRNEPARVKLVAEKIAELRHITYEELANATMENAQRLFKI
ncbi:TatD family hydrolase [Terrilactibacillus tamarindi]|uniref:TatD family hydrolase n=1 Tax=Terrilactibacillus tamarindi TaxID=2599694 RepID=UPI002E2F385E|nr:TatD family hydrolase [Terrilactibacillus tamarindi]